MTPREILVSFCEPVTAKGSALEGPWQQGGYAYASNRHWMVRMPALGMGDLLPRTPSHPNNADTFFEMAPQDGFAPMEALPGVCACPECRGTLFSPTGACPSCAGTGAFVHHGHTYDCAHCDGSGSTSQPDEGPADSKVACTACSGTGFDLDFDKLALYGTLRTQWFKPGYLHAIARLPGVTFAAGQGLGPAAFRFDGDGEGVLMPCRPPSFGSA